jgi:hypothetical protein
MALNIMGNFIIIKEKAAERWNMQTVKSMRVISRMTNLKDMGHGRELMETYTWENSKMTSNTAMEFTNGLMDQCIKDSTERVAIMGGDITDGQMEVNIGDSSRITSKNGEGVKKEKEKLYNEKYLEEKLINKSKITEASSF